MEGIIEPLIENSCIKEIIKYRLLNNSWKKKVDQMAPKEMCQICRRVILFPHNMYDNPSYPEWQGCNAECIGEDSRHMIFCKGCKYHYCCGDCRPNCLKCIGKPDWSYGSPILFVRLNYFVDRDRIPFYEEDIRGVVLKDYHLVTTCGLCSFKMTEQVSITMQNKIRLCKEISRR